MSTNSLCSGQGGAPRRRREEPGAASPTGIHLYKKIDNVPWRVGGFAAQRPRPTEKPSQIPRDLEKPRSRSLEAPRRAFEVDRGASKRLEEQSKTPKEPRSTSLEAPRRAFEDPESHFERPRRTSEGPESHLEQPRRPFEDPETQSSGGCNSSRATRNLQSLRSTGLEEPRKVFEDSDGPFESHKRSSNRFEKFFENLEGTSIDELRRARGPGNDEDFEKPAIEGPRSASKRLRRPRKPPRAASKSLDAVRGPFEDPMKTLIGGTSSRRHRRSFEETFEYELTSLRSS